MKKAACALALAALGLVFLGGCGFSSRLGGPKSWWDDQKGQQLPDDYKLPPAPSAKPEAPTGK